MLPHHQLGTWTLLTPALGCLPAVDLQNLKEEALMFSLRPILQSVLSGVAAVALWGVSNVHATSKHTQGDFEIRTLSTRAFAVSGGDVLIEVKVPRYVRHKDLVFKLNGVEVSAAFKTESSRRLRGLVTGLREGRNVVTVGARYHHHNVHFEKLEITNHPISGEIFGPHQRPWICETEASGLGAPPTQGPCVAQTRYEWFYRTTAGTFQPLTSLTPPFPADLAQTTTIDGNTVNYIVRVESGVINESIYRIAIIDDPTHPITKPWSAGGKKPGPGWNGKLTWPFGGGASPAYRSGRNVVTSALQDIPLKSRLRRGVWYPQYPRHRVRRCRLRRNPADDQGALHRAVWVAEVHDWLGRSGGAIQQHLIAYNYPGLLDALTPNIPYPDVVSVAIDVIDCHLLNNYFNNLAHPADWPGSRRSKVDGYAVATSGPAAGQTVCQTGWSGLAEAWQDARGAVPNRGFDPVIPQEVRYDPVTNPSGARGTLWDSNVASLGRGPDHRICAFRIRQCRCAVRPESAQ